MEWDTFLTEMTFPWLSWPALSTAGSAQSMCFTTTSLNKITLPGISYLLARAANLWVENSTSTQPRGWNLTHSTPSTTVLSSKTICSLVSLTTAGMFLMLSFVLSTDSRDSK